MLYESQELVTKLKPAFEEEVQEEKLDLPQNLEDLSISSSKSCSTCGVTFDSTEDQRAHFKLDWHRFNIANKLKGLKSISEDQFEDQLENLSLSGSESSEDDEMEKLEEKTSKLPKIFLTHSEDSQQVYSIQKVILPDFKPKAKLKWAIFMLGGGHFAGLLHS